MLYYYYSIKWILTIHVYYICMYSSNLLNEFRRLSSVETSIINPKQTDGCLGGGCEENFHTDCRHFHVLLLRKCISSSDNHLDLKSLDMLLEQLLNNHMRKTKASLWNKTDLINLGIIRTLSIFCLFYVFHHFPDERMAVVFIFGH